MTNDKSNVIYLEPMPWADEPDTRPLTDAEWAEIERLTKQRGPYDFHPNEGQRMDDTDLDMIATLLAATLAGLAALFGVVFFSLIGIKAAVSLLGPPLW